MQDQCQNMPPTYSQIQKLKKKIQNVMQCSAAGCTLDTNIQHLHDKTMTIFRHNSHLQHIKTLHQTRTLVHFIQQIHGSSILHSWAHKLFSVHFVIMCTHLIKCIHLTLPHNVNKLQQRGCQIYENQVKRWGPLYLAGEKDACCNI